MKRLIPILASAASMTIPVAAMADNIVCHGGWSIERHVTGSASSGFMSYMKDVGVIKLLHNGKLISQKRIQDIQQSVYQTSGAPLVNYEFDVDKNSFYILATGKCSIHCDDCKGNSLHSGWTKQEGIVHEKIITDALSKAISGIDGANDCGVSCQHMRDGYGGILHLNASQKDNELYSEWTLIG
jgi:hypothetical protein